MKRLIPILLAVFAFAACEKDPDMDKLDNDYLVYTNYDKKADFKQFSTYYIPDSVLVIGDKKDPEYWKGEAAEAIINAYKENLNSKGFTYLVVFVLMYIAGPGKYSIDHFIAKAISKTNR